MNMDKGKIIEILEDYEFFVDDDFGGHYEHINCSQKALTPLGIIEILDYISNLEQQCKKQQEVIDKTVEYIKENIYSYYDSKGEKYIEETVFERSANPKELLDILKEVSE